MRLEVLDNGHGWGARLKLGLIRVFTGQRPPDIVRLLLYRPELFGAAASDLVDDLLRGPSRWSIYERELFAAFTSRVNECEF